MNLEETISALVADYGAEADPDQVTAEAMAAIGLIGDLAELCHSAVKQCAINSIAHRRRANRPNWTRPTPTPAAEPTQAKHVNAIARPDWMNERFALGDGRIITWADATVEDHQARITFQLKLASGIKRDIDNHAEAIRRIEAAGVACLADLPEYGGTKKKAAA